MDMKFILEAWIFFFFLLSVYVRSMDLFCLLIFTKSWKTAMYQVTTLLFMYCCKLDVVGDLSALSPSQPG